MTCLLQQKHTTCAQDRTEMGARKQKRNEDLSLKAVIFSSRGHFKDVNLVISGFVGFMAPSPGI